MKTISDGARCASLVPAALILCAIAISAALCWFILCLATTVNQVPHQMTAIRQATLQQLTTLEADSLKLIDKQASGIRQDASKQITGIRTDVMTQLSTTVDVFNARTLEALGKLDPAQKDLDKLTNSTVRDLDSARMDLDGIQMQLRPTLQNLATATGKASDIATHIDDALPPFTDCAYLDDSGSPIGGNPDCVFNRYQGASKAFENTMIAIGKAAPGVSTSAEGISQSVAKEAASLTKPQTFWQGFKSWLLIISRCIGFFL